MTKLIPVAFAIVAFGSSLTSAFANGRTSADDVSGLQASFVQSAPAPVIAGNAATAQADRFSTDVVNKADRQY